MAAEIAKKIDFLMKLTGTQNAALARALSFDASYISRIRNGRRGLPQHQPFIEPAAAYFARNICEDYQKSAAAEQLRLGRSWPESEAETRALLAAWMKSEPDARDEVERLAEAMSTEAPAQSEYPAAGGIRTEVALFYGNAGRRDGVISFLSELCRSEKAHTLLLYSDEDIAWLYEDDGFARTWTKLLMTLARNGGRIKIIHSVARDANEMWEAVRKWLPLYMSGAIEPYYYPRLRDGVFHRTLFVASGHSAMIANSVQSGGDTLNIMLSNKAAVLALEDEFNDFLALCRPLMENMRPRSAKALSTLLTAFMKARGEPQAAWADDILLCSKQDFGALAVRTEAPYTAFVIKEPRMVAAVEEYLGNLPAAEESCGRLTAEQLGERIEQMLQKG